MGGQAGTLLPAFFFLLHPLAKALLSAKACLRRRASLRSAKREASIFFAFFFSEAKIEADEKKQVSSFERALGQVSTPG